MSLENLNSITNLDPRVQAILALIVIVLTIMSPVGDLIRSLLDFRSGKRNLEMKKAHLEIIRLRYEFEQLRKENPVAQLDQEYERLFPALMPKLEPKLSASAQALRWLARYPRFSSLVLGIIQIILGIPAVSLILSGIVLLLPNDEFPDIGHFIIPALLSFALGWLLIRCIQWLGKQRRLLKPSKLPLVPSPAPAS